MKSPGMDPETRQFEPLTEEIADYFLSRIERQALAEGRPLSEGERLYLLEDERSGIPDLDRLWADDKFSDTFEERVTRLLEGALRHEKGVNPDAEMGYRRELARLDRTESLVLWKIARNCSPEAKLARQRLRLQNWVLQASIVFVAFWIFRALARWLF